MARVVGRIPDTRAARVVPRVASDGSPRKVLARRLSAGPGGSARRLAHGSPGGPRSGPGTPERGAAAGGSKRGAGVRGGAVCAGVNGCGCDDGRRGRGWRAVGGWAPTPSGDSSGAQRAGAVRRLTESEFVAARRWNTRGDGYTPHTRGSDVPPFQGVTVPAGAAACRRVGGVGTGGWPPARVVARAGGHPPSSTGRGPGYSTVTDLARLRGLSMSRPSANAVW
ncbi:hypothetical protein GCM10023324_66390 [Streptomyces youssoufiensis]